MRAVIIAVGNELTSGQTRDTNSPWLARQLEAMGIETARHVTVGDDAAATAEAIVAAAGEAELVMVTGGLGPTLDDLSRQALATAMGTPLAEDARQAERIAAFFAARGREMKPSNRTQALAPAGSEMIDNDCGTAPGLAARVGRADVFIMPGVPHEMEAMFADKIAPRLTAPRGSEGSVKPAAIARRTIHTFGTGESDIGETIADLMARGRNPTVGTTASGGVISVRIVALAGSSAEAAAAADADVAEVRRRLGDIVFGAESETLAGALAAACRASGRTVATAESCTGGLIGEMITDVSGSSAYYLGGVVAYANAAKTALLGVPPELLKTHGAVSEPVAATMAEGARRRFASDLAVSTTGIAGPAGGTPEKPVGLVYVGLAAPGGTTVRRCLFPGDRRSVRVRTALVALNQLRVEAGKR